MKSITKYGIILFLFVALFSQSCRDDEFSEPDKLNRSAPEITSTIFELKNEIYQPAGDTLLTYIDTSIVIGGRVVANDHESNYYKAIVIQDSTGGIELSLNAYELQSAFPLGSRVHVKCEGLYIGDYGGILKLGGIYEGGIGRLEEPIIGEHVFPDSREYLPVIDTLEYGNLNQNDINTVVVFDSVQFKLGQLGRTFADPRNLIESTVILEDRNQNSIPIVTSGYAEFAGDTLPAGLGTATLIYSQYNGDDQFKIRSFDEIKLTKNRVGAIYEKNFQDRNILTPGSTLDNSIVPNNPEWISKVVTGPYDWTTSDQGSSGDYYAVLSNYESGENTESEVWLISPEFDISSLNAPYLMFQNACNYGGPALELKISTDYDGESLPETADWTDISFNQSQGGFNWVSSGIIELNEYSSSAFRIAIVYKGSDSDGRTWEVDDIALFESE